MTEVGVERLRAGNNEKNCAQRHKSNHAMGQQEAYAMDRIEGQQHRGILHDLQQARARYCDKPDQRDGPEECRNLGGATHYEYTVIGDAVNEAARLTELAKTTPARLLASDAIVSRAGGEEAEHWRLGEEVTLRGRAAPTRLATSTPRAG